LTSVGNTYWKGTTTFVDRLPLVISITNALKYKYTDDDTSRNIIITMYNFVHAMNVGQCRARFICGRVIKSFSVKKKLFRVSTRSGDTYIYIYEYIVEWHYAKHPVYTCGCVKNTSIPTKMKKVNKRTVHRLIILLCSRTRYLTTVAVADEYITMARVSKRYGLNVCRNTDTSSKSTGSITSATKTSIVRARVR